MHYSKIIFVLIVLTGWAAQSSKAVVFWDNDSKDQKWNTPANWGGNAGPTSTPAIDIGEPDGPDECIIAAGVLANEPDKLYLGNNPETLGALRIQGGSLQCSQFLYVGYKGCSSLRMENGTTRCVLYDLSVGTNQGSHGTFEAKDSTITCGRNFLVGASGTGICKLQNCTIRAVGMYSGYNAPGEGNRIELTDCDLRFDQWFQIAKSAGCRDELIMNGGTLVIDSYDFCRYSLGSYTVRINGGTIRTGRHFYVGYGGSDVLTMEDGRIETGILFIGSDSTAAGQINLNGGTIEASDLRMNPNALLSRLELNGGEVIIDGDRRQTLKNYMEAGLIRSYGGAGRILIDYNHTVPGKTWMKGVMTPPPATAPSPADAAYGIATDSLVLSWKPGEEAESHDLYFGSDFSEVENAADPESGAGLGTLTGSSFPLSETVALTPDTVYYWRVDERNSYGVTKGAVWSFRTRDVRAFVMENETYGVELLPDRSIRLTEKNSWASCLFAPDFIVMYSSVAPKIGFNSDYAIGPKCYRNWGAYGGTINAFEAGIPTFISANQAVVNAGKISWAFPEPLRFRLEANLTFDADCREPKLEFQMHVKQSGWYSVGYLGAESVAVSFIENFPQAANHWGSLPPAGAVNCEVLSTMSAVLIADANRGINYAVLVDPEVVPFRLPTKSDARFGMTMVNAAGEAEPIIWSPEMGGYGSALDPGESHSFALRLFVKDGKWSDAYRQIARTVYDFRDQRDNSGPGSMNRTLGNFIDHVTDAYGGNHQMWDAEQKMNEYYMDESYAFKMTSALYPISAAITVDDENFYWSRALPQIEFAMSRVLKYIEPYDFEGWATLTRNTDLGEPFMGSNELSILYRMTNERTAAFRIYGLEKSPPSTASVYFALQMQHYHFTGDVSWRERAIANANARIAAGNIGTSFEDWLQMYEETGDPAYLEAAQTAERNFETSLNVTPRVPDTTIVVDLNNQAPIHPHSSGRWVLWESLGLPVNHPCVSPPRPMYAPQQEVPAWRPALTGMQPEMASYHAFTFCDYASDMLRLSGYTGDDFSRAMARWALCGRWANYPGEILGTAYSLAYEQWDFPMHELDYLSFSSFHMNHPWFYLTWCIDYLVADAMSKSGGRIFFPSRQIQNDFYARVHDLEGCFYGDQGVRLWLPKNLLEIGSEQIDYIAGYGNGKLYLAFSNQSFSPVSTTVTINPSLASWDAVHPAALWVQNEPQGSITVQNGSFPLNVAASGITAVVIDGIRVQTRLQHKIYGSREKLTDSSLVRTEQSFGKMNGMILSFGPELTNAFVYTNVKPYWMSKYEEGDYDTSYVTMHYRPDNGAWQTETDEIFPFEFSVPLDPAVSQFQWYFEVFDVNGVPKTSTVETLSLTTVPAGLTVWGRVTDAEGTGIANVRVSSSKGPVAYTDVAGLFAIRGVEDASQTLTVSKAGYSFVHAARDVAPNGRDVAPLNWIGTEGTLGLLDHLLVLAVDWLEDGSIDIEGATTCPLPPQGDLNGDCKVNLFDFVLMETE